MALAVELYAKGTRMAPRQYELGQRATAMEATRQRIIEATIDLHRDQGIVATSYRDIAGLADVGLGAVYHHFPTVDDLAMACGGRMFEVTQPPSRDVFTGLRSRRTRIEHLVNQMFAWYGPYPSWRGAICDTAEADKVTTVLAVIDYEVYRTLVDDGRSTVEAAMAMALVLLSGI